MSTTSPCDHRGVPTTLLGMSYRSWTGTQIQIILDHYQWQYDQITRSKQNLMHELDLLIQEHDLDIQDRRDILNALKRGDPLPRRKSRVRRVPHSALPDRKAIARRERAQNRAQTRAFTDPSHKSASALPRDCTVCFETLNPQTIPERRITSSCSHEPDVCRSCLATSIATQLDSKVWDHIDCPTCGQRLGFQDVKEFADHEVFERLEPFCISDFQSSDLSNRYDNYSLQSCLSSGQFQRCRHPHCQSGQQCFPEQDSYMICVACRGRTCITCDIIWHPSETCANVAARRAEARGAEEAAAMEYLTTRVKLCPRCNVRGEKVDGCDHMECKNEPLRLTFSHTYLYHCH